MSSSSDIVINDGLTNCGVGTGAAVVGARATPPTASTIVGAAVAKVAAVGAAAEVGGA